MKVVIIKSEDWDGIYLNGELHFEGHELSDGNGEGLFLLELANKYNFNYNDIEIKYVDGCEVSFQNNYLINNGCYPNSLKEFYPDPIQPLLYTINDIIAAWEASYDYYEQLTRINNGHSNFTEPTNPNKDAYIRAIKRV